MQNNRKKQPRIVYSRPMRKTARRNPITVALPLLALGAFIWLAIYSQSANSAGGYSEKDRKAFNALVERELGGKSQPIQKDKRRAIIMDIYNITEADIANPVALWRD